MPRNHQDPDTIALQAPKPFAHCQWQAANLLRRRNKATMLACFYFSTFIRGSATIFAALLYANCELIGLPILPISKWVKSPFEHKFALNLSTIAIVYAIYCFVSFVHTYLMWFCFDANSTFRRRFGYEYDPEQGSEHMDEQHKKRK